VLRRVQGSSVKANLYALGAIALWATLAALGVSLTHIPPFLLTGLALLIGSVIALPLSGFDLRQWRIPGTTLALGVYGLFGFHLLLFIALRNAPAVEANLVNYLWPLLMVVLAPVFLAGMQLRTVHVVAALLGFAGAAIAILGSQGNGSAGTTGLAGWSWGYLPALASAFIWASYSLLCQRVKPFPTAAIGLFGLVSGLLSLVCHWALEPAVVLNGRDWVLISVLGLGPLGAAFFLWDQALKLGDARQIGILSYLTPLASTALLMAVNGRAFTWNIALSAVMIIGAALLGTRTR
jgi:drug/metabolite transporter (DMT)-like permease